MQTQNKIELIKFNKNLTKVSLEYILKDVKNVCVIHKESISKTRRIYGVAVELLDNSYMHAEIFQYNDMIVNFLMYKINDGYYIKVKNIISNREIKNFKTRLDILSSKNKQELKDIYKIKLLNSTISDKGGAGLGLINVARKAEKIVEYKFEKINNKKSYFTIEVEIK